MLTALTFASFFGLAEYLGVGTQADAYFNCSDPAFFVVRNENQITGDKHLQLKGTINAPQQGYSYRFQFVTVEPPQAYAILSLGQGLNQAQSQQQPYGRGLPSIQQIQVDQKFTVPQDVVLLRVRVEGLTPMPTEFGCDITQRPVN